MPIINLNQTPEELEENAKLMIEEAQKKREELASQVKRSKRTKKPIDQIDFEDMDMAMHKKLNEVLNKEDSIIEMLKESQTPEATKPTLGASTTTSQKPMTGSSQSGYDEFDEEAATNKEEPNIKYFDNKKPKIALSNMQLAVIVIVFIVIGIILHYLGIL